MIEMDKDVHDDIEDNVWNASAVIMDIDSGVLIRFWYLSPWYSFVMLVWYISGILSTREIMWDNLLTSEKGRKNKAQWGEDIISWSISIDAVT